MAVKNLLPNDGVSFSNGIKFQLTTDDAGEAGNATIVMTGGPLVAVCQALNIPSLNIVTDIRDISKLVRGINIAQQMVSIL